MTAALLTLCASALALAASPDLRARLAGYAGLMRSEALWPCEAAALLRRDLATYSGPVDGERLLRAALAIVEPADIVLGGVTWPSNAYSRAVLAAVDDPAPGLAHLDERDAPALPDDTWK